MLYTDTHDLTGKDKRHGYDARHSQSDRCLVVFFLFLRMVFNGRSAQKGY
jgi:hypothetical protein